MLNRIKNGESLVPFLSALPDNLTAPSTSIDARQPAVVALRTARTNLTSRIYTAFKFNRANANNSDNPIKSSQVWRRILANGETRKIDVEEIGALIASELATPGGTASFMNLQRQFARADQQFDDLEKTSGIRLGECRYTTKKILLQNAIATPDCNFDELVHEYKQADHFRGKYKILTEAVRFCLEADLRSEFGDRRGQESRRVKRLLRDDLTACTQEDYVRHVCGLFNLEEPVSQEAWGKMRAQATPAHRHAMASLGVSVTPPDGLRFKTAIAFFASALRADTDTDRGADKRMRNQHPASVLLEASTGLVYHPHFENASLTDTNSGFAFENIAETLRDKYLAAKQSGDLRKFFQTAFVRQDPCYEAVAENLMNYASATVIFHPKPSWISSLSDEDNLAGLLAWTERGLVHEYANKARINLATCDVKDLNRIESSHEFANFLASNTDKIVQILTKEQNSLTSLPLIRKIVEDDIALGIKLTAKTANSSTLSR